jgi:hypothetical protein
MAYMLYLATLAGLVFAGYALVLYPYLFHPLSRIPNAHPLAPFSSLWILWTRYCDRELENVHQSHQKLGSVVRIGPNELSVNSVEGVRAVHTRALYKPKWYECFTHYK